MTDAVDSDPPCAVPQPSAILRVTSASIRSILARGQGLCLWKDLADGHQAGQGARVFDEDDSSLAVVHELLQEMPRFNSSGA
jgi:hypothetical protein